MAHASRKQYLAIFGTLAVLTALEVAVTKVPGISHRLMASALILMALGKAGLVALFFMHLRSDTKVMKMTVLLPFAFPALYAFVLIAEAAWRGTH